MTKAKGETARRQLDRISKLERRMRQLYAKPRKTPSNIAEISALEWAIPILEQYVVSAGDEALQMRISWHKHEKRHIVAALWQRDGDICYLCNKPLHYDAATIDHVVPLSKGGYDDTRNYRLVHSLCNVQKGNLTLDQFRAAQEKAGITV